MITGVCRYSQDTRIVRNCIGLHTQPNAHKSTAQDGQHVCACKVWTAYLVHLIDDACRLQVAAVLSASNCCSRLSSRANTVSRVSETKLLAKVLRYINEAERQRHRCIRASATVLKGSRDQGEVERAHTRVTVDFCPTQRLLACQPALWQRRRVIYILAAPM